MKKAVVLVILLFFCGTLSVFSTSSSQNVKIISSPTVTVGGGSRSSGINTTMFWGGVGLAAVGLIIAGMGGSDLADGNLDTGIKMMLGGGGIFIVGCILIAASLL